MMSLPDWLQNSKVSAPLPPVKMSAHVRDLLDRVAALEAAGGSAGDAGTLGTAAGRKHQWEQREGASQGWGRGEMSLR